MDECPSTTSSSTASATLNWQDYVSRTECILTYGGHSPVDLWLNYGLLSINLLVCGLWLWNRRGDEFHRFAPAFGSLVFAVAFQIVLCLQVGCSGISIGKKTSSLEIIMVKEGMIHTYSSLLALLGFCSLIGSASVVRLLWLVPL